MNLNHPRHTVPQELRTSEPRLARLTPGGVRSVAGFLILVLGAGILLLLQCAWPSVRFPLPPPLDDLVGGLTLFLIVAVALLPMAFYHFLRNRRVLHLLRHGAPARGVVRQVHMSTDGPTVYEYAYSLPDGQARVARMVQLDMETTRAVGEVVTVLYDPRRPRRSVIYEEVLGIARIVGDTAASRSAAA